ncbi:OmpH family outer membrane protein [Echinicola jeungdonensis]|uniref:OmpH family outer membrane protein n=1 Tax=Echinicola jeungdonensis TaxID=709343 RepID=A0ABV5J3G2_9BACT|nr:OmpH family outer membrane protein [Echinicola jeungdonensis]MDN3668607.1 OmpH family outer membrane protein [Echinicola jeungdonensis]MDN3671290.1 OmpH family outer membrane protein [Echinicola jeungdonensis]
MEKCLKLLLLLLLLSSGVMAQKIGFVDSEYVLNKHPEYKKIQEDLKALGNAWKKEAQNLEQEIKEMYNSLKAEEVLLTEEMYNERLEAIKEKEKEATAFNTRVFGIKGQYYQKQAELLQPLQSEIFDAIDKVAKRQGIAIMFDKAADLSMIYTDPVHDYSDFVLEELGLEENK